VTIRRILPFYHVGEKWGPPRRIGPAAPDAAGRPTVINGKSQ
jgi:hypothetical protein